MKFLFTMSLCLAWTTMAMAQSSINGEIRDKLTGEPLVGATIILKGTQEGATTDLNGQFSLTTSVSGQITLEASYVGYYSNSKSLELSGSTSIDFSLESKILSEQIVVKGIRAEEKDPITQKTIDKKQIEEKYIGQEGAFLLERISPAIVSYSEAGTGVANYGQFRLRGIDQTRVNITLNGVPLNDMIDQGVFFSNFTDFGNSISSVQVQRGVGTSTNGTASYGGSVNFESVNLRDSVASAELQLLGGSFDTYRGSLEFKSGLIDDKFAAYGRFSQTYSNGYRDHSGVRAYSFFFSGAYFGEKDMLRFTGFTGRSQRDLAYTPVPIELIDQDPRTNLVSNNDIDDFGQQLLQVQYVRWFNPNFSLNSSIYYGGAGGDFPFGFDDGSGGFIQLNFPLFNDHYGLMSVLNYEDVQGRFNFSGGVHGYLFRRKNEESSFPQIRNITYSDRTNKDELSFFLKASKSINKFNFFADLQFRFVSLDLMPDQDFLSAPIDLEVRNYEFVNPKVGVSYDFDRNNNLYFSYGRSGREPTRADILGTSTINDFNLPSIQNLDAVRPEYVNDFELGVRHQSERFTASANLYYMRFENEIAPIGVFIPEIFGQLRTNISKSSRRGIEVDWLLKLNEKLNFRGDVAYLDGNIESFQPEGSTEVFEDREQIFAPNWTSNFELLWSSSSRTSMRLAGRYVSESFLELTNDPEFILPDFYTFDWQINYQLSKSFELSFLVNNIFDEEYFTFGTPADTDFDGINDTSAYLIQAPRSYYLTMKVKI
ncbi:MAG: TonB-dependent receptor [Bacteroidota bacterium]